MTFWVLTPWALVGAKNCHCHDTSKRKMLLIIGYWRLKMIRHKITNCLAAWGFKWKWKQGYLKWLNLRVMTLDGHLSDLAWLHVSPHLAAQAVSWIGACTEHRLRVWPHPTSGGPHPCPGIIWTFTLDCSHTLKRMEIEMETGWCILLYLLST